MAGMSVDGLVSGLSTSALISQLLQVEAIPQDQLKTKVKTQESAVAALQAVNAKFLSVLTAAKEVGKAATWDAMKATASSAKAAATAEPGATPGQVSFAVGALARAHSVVSAEFAAVGDLGPDITLTSAAGSLTVATTDTDTVVRTINESALGLRAVVVQVADGSYRLQVTAKDTGAADTFTMSGASRVVAQGADAEIYLGGTATGVRITSASNTFTDLMPGTDVTVAELTSGAETVTVTVAADKSAISARVKTLVDAANGALAEIAKQTASSDLGAAVLAGDSTLRQLANSVLDAVGAGAGGSLAGYGLELDRTGRLSFDAAAFEAAYAADPAGARARFLSPATFTPAAGASGVSLLGAANTALTGTRSVVVTQAATRSTWAIGATTGDSVAAGSALTLTRTGGRTATVTAGAPTETLADLAARLDAAAEDADLGLAVTYDALAQEIVVTSDGFGSATAFTLTGTGDFAAATVTNGRDVAGSVAGVAATGKGQVLTSPDGLTLSVPLDPAAVAALPGGAAGTVSYAPGFAQRLEILADRATRADNGLLTTAVLSRTGAIEDMTDRIADWDRRLELRRTALTRQFAAMELALSKLQSQSSWLAGQISGLPSYSTGD